MKLRLIIGISYIHNQAIILSYHHH